MSEPRELTPAEATAFYREGIDEAVRTHNVALLADLIRTANTLTPEAREHLAAVTEGLLTKKIKFPNRKPKQDLEEKRQAIAERVWELKKSTGWKLRSVVDSVAKERRCSQSTVWAAWGEFGDALAAGYACSEKYDLDVLFAAIRTSAQQGVKLDDEHADILKSMVVERLGPDALKPPRSK